MKKLFIKFRYLLLAIVMLITCYIYVYAVGHEYTCEFNCSAALSGSAGAEICIDDDGKDMLEVTHWRYSGDTAYVGVRSKNPGRAYVYVQNGSES